MNHSSAAEGPSVSSADVSIIESYHRLNQICETGIDKAMTVQIVELIKCGVDPDSIVDIIEYFRNSR